MKSRFVKITQWVCGIMLALSILFFLLLALVQFLNPAYGKERPTGLARIAGGFIDALTENKFDLDRRNFASGKKISGHFLKK